MAHLIWTKTAKPINSSRAPTALKSVCTTLELICGSREMLAAGASPFWWTRAHGLGIVWVSVVSSCSIWSIRCTPQSHILHVVKYPKTDRLPTVISAQYDTMNSNILYVTFEGQLSQLQRQVARVYTRWRAQDVRQGISSPWAPRGGKVQHWLYFRHLRTPVNR